MTEQKTWPEIWADEEAFLRSVHLSEALVPFEEAFRGIKQIRLDSEASRGRCSCSSHLEPPSLSDDALSLAGDQRLLTDNLHQWVAAITRGEEHQEFSVLDVETLFLLAWGMNAGLGSVVLTESDVGEVLDKWELEWGIQPNLSELELTKIYDIIFRSRTVSREPLEYPDDDTVVSALTPLPALGLLESKDFREIVVQHLESTPVTEGWWIAEETQRLLQNVP